MQIYLERVVGMDFVTVKMQYNWFFWVMRLATGFTFLWGVTYLWRDLWKLGPARNTGAGGSLPHTVAASPEA